MARSKKQLEPSPRPPSVFDNGEFVVRRTFQNDQGYQMPVVEDAEAREVLQRIASGKARDGDYYFLGGIDARLGAYDESVLALRSEILMNTLSDVLGPDFKAETIAELGTDKPAPPTREQLAKEKSESITTAFHIATGQFKKKNDEPKKTLVARRMFELGFFLGDIADVSGYSRGLLGDARQYWRAQYIRDGKELPPNLKLDPKRGAKRTGDDLRGGSGALFEQNREASRLVASVADVLAPAPPKMKRRAYRNENEGIASAPINGTWDLGDYDDEGENSDE